MAGKDIGPTDGIGRNDGMAVIDTKKDDAVVRVLSMAGRPMGPTEIGKALGIPYERASSAVTPTLKRLLRAGKIRRVILGGRKVAYEIAR